MDAAAVEQRVHDALVRRDPALDVTEPDIRHAIHRALLFEVAVGATVDELMFVWRTRTADHTIGDPLTWTDPPTAIAGDVNDRDSHTRSAWVRDRRSGEDQA